MATNKTAPTTVDASTWLATLEPAQRRTDALAICTLLAAATGAAPVLWSSNIIGFGTYTAVSPSGRTSDWMRIGYAPRKASHVLYLMDGFDGQADLLTRLGKATTGVSCLYVKRLADIDTEVLAEMARRSWAMMAAMMAERYPA